MLGHMQKDVEWTLKVQTFSKGR